MAVTNTTTGPTARAAGEAVHAAAEMLSAGGWVQDFLSDPAGMWQRVGEHVLRWVGLYGPVGAPAAALTAVTVLVARRYRLRRRHELLRTDAYGLAVLAPPSVDPAGGEALWANLVGLLRPAWKRRLGGQPHLAVEYGFSASGVTITLWVPGVIPPHLIERAVEAAWPGAHTERLTPTPDPVPTGDAYAVAGGELRLARCEALPIRTDFDADPLRAVMGAPAGLGPDEHACVQILARPATGRRLARTRRAARNLRNGRSTRLTGRLLDLLTPGGPRRRATSTASPAAVHPLVRRENSQLDAAITRKDRGSSYETLVRYAATTHVGDSAGAVDRETWRKAQEQARGRAHALAAAFATYTDLNHYTRRRLRQPAQAIAARELRRGDVLSVPELAALAHVPTDISISGLRRAGARALPAPPEVAAPGPDAKRLGVSDSGQARGIGLRTQDARHHVHVLGATGSGKSTLLATMVLDDIAAGRGCVVIDPKGDLVTDLLARMPANAGDRLVLFDADSRRRPPCLNPLDGPDPDRDVDNLTSVFRRIYAAYWGPRTDDVMRAACLTLRHTADTATLADLPRLLAEDAYRDRVLAQVSDPVLRGFWSWYDSLSDSARAHTISPLMNKLRAVLLRPFARQALTAGPNTADLPSVLDGGVLLARIPKGSLGDETSRLVGSLIVARTWQATTARAAQPQHQRRDASLVIDECHNFLNLPYPIEDMLAEARGFRVSITLAHQHLGQLPTELAEGIATNARSKIYFTASPDDARKLARHTHPRLGEHDLAHLGAYTAAARLVVDGQNTDAFTVASQPLPNAIPGRSRHLRHAAHQHTTRARQHPPTAARPEGDPRRDTPEGEQGNP